MRTLLTGAGGQVGREIVRLESAHQISLTGFEHRDLDITSTDSLHRVMDTLHPDLVINAAAYTKVDLAESEPDAATRVNRTGPGLLAGELKTAGVRGNPQGRHFWAPEKRVARLKDAPIQARMPDIQ